MGKSSFIITNIILLIVFLALIKNIFQLAGNLFMLELLILIILLVMATDSTWQYIKGNRTSTGALSIFFAIVLVNEIGLNIFAKTPLHITLTIAAALGFIITLVTKKECECCQMKQPSEDTEYKTEITPVEEEKIVEYKEDKEEKKKPKKTRKKKTTKKKRK